MQGVLNATLEAIVTSLDGPFSTNSAMMWFVTTVNYGKPKGVVVRNYIFLAAQYTLVFAKYALVYFPSLKLGGKVHKCYQAPPPLRNALLCFGKT